MGGNSERDEKLDHMIYKPQRGSISLFSLIAR